MRKSLLPAIKPAPKPTESELAERVAVLNANDRCDSCETAQARVRVTLGTGQVLLFCKHHYERHIDALQRYDVLDERWTLEAA